jgi:hypothetical protein
MYHQSSIVLLLLTLISTCRGSRLTPSCSDSSRFVNIVFLKQCNGDTLQWPEINIYHKKFNGKENLYFNHIFQDTEVLRLDHTKGKYNRSELQKCKVVYARTKDLNVRMNVRNIPIVVDNIRRDTVITLIRVYNLRVNPLWFADIGKEDTIEVLIEYMDDSIMGTRYVVDIENLNILVPGAEDFWISLIHNGKLLKRINSNSLNCETEFINII